METREAERMGDWNYGNRNSGKEEHRYRIINPQSRLLQGDWSAKSVFRVKLLLTYARQLNFPQTFHFAVFGKSGCIKYALPRAEHVYMRIYSINGQMQSEPVNKYQNAGYYLLNMQKGMLGNRPYIVVFKAGNYYQEKMLFLMK